MSVEPYHEPGAVRLWGSKNKYDRMLRSLQLLRPIRCECAARTGSCGNTEVCVHLPSPHQVPRLREWFSFTVWESVEKNGE